MRYFVWLTTCIHALSFSRISATASESIDDSLLWGPYKPNVYFGLRPRISESLSLGLMWTSAADGHLDSKNIRHTCEQSDGLAQYGWTMYDVRAGGTQDILDPKNNLNLTTSFVKMPEGGRRGSWGARVRGVFRNVSLPCNARVIWYISMENGAGTNSNALHCRESDAPKDIECQGYSHGLGSFTIRLPFGQVENTSFHGIHVPDDNLWKAKGNTVPLFKL